jgi:hypothetical protein
MPVHLSNEDVSLVGAATLWFVPDIERPWRAQVDGITYACRSVTIHSGKTQFKDEGFRDLLGGPRGVVVAELAQLFAPVIIESRAAP